MNKLRQEITVSVTTVTEDLLFPQVKNKFNNIFFKNIHSKIAVLKIRQNKNLVHHDKDYENKRYIHLNKEHTHIHRMETIERMDLLKS